ncbi:3',5'-cyclic-AMP phosphodiesterase [Halioxenophilus sp. WMMB6]|uniref:3',5'-cyclic-AMP phosphodiesterase n=1 Tax=Halioxenophilus sp. WMMB6 TaxID=3073815 RepID=UPI00295F208D|nr:3',5'-cyclic-AMP phosphodiesterase [Halioxenophilus sp. WMMB6]
MYFQRDTIRIAQISDPHLGKNPGDCLLGVDTDRSLNDVLSQLPEHDLVIASGDLSNDGSPESYRRFADTLAHAGINSWSCLPGNHDDEQVMQRVLGPEVVNRVMVHDSWLLVLLNSRVPGYEYGNLSDRELAFLDKALSRNSNMNAMVFLHHQPVPVGCRWLDQYIVRSADRFFSVLDRHDNVRAVAWGHVHQDFQTIRNGVQLFGTPSTCAQFKPNSDDFAVDTAMPGYRLFELHRDGGISTQVNRVGVRDYNIDLASCGY